MSAPAPLLWYGDDFTGASDTLAVLAQAGLRAVLFMGVPTAQQREQADQALGGALDAIGIAGHARSLSPAAMVAELAPVANYFRTSGCRVLHYKVCSTFDSAPHVGSIGRALELLRSAAAHPFVPIVGGQPSLGRYCAFSHLFAAAGAGGTIERIDRHPTMSRHPVTPMGEADLRRHLALQGLSPVAHWHLPSYHLNALEQDRHLGALLDQSPAGILMDVTEPAHLSDIGRMIWQAADESPLLAVGASSVAQALIPHWPGHPGNMPSRSPGQASDHWPGQLPGPEPARPSTTSLAGTPSTPAPLAPARGPVLVFAGSLSPVTAAQVARARRFDTVALDARVLLEAGEPSTRLQDQVFDKLVRARHTLAVTAPQAGQRPDTSVSSELARCTQAWIAQLLARLIDAGERPPRLGIVGGDTSSLAVRALPLWGLSYAGTLGPGVPLCRVHSEHPGLDGLELMLKGGQMGDVGVLDRLVDGHSPH